MKENLVGIMELIRSEEKEELPYFYWHLDSMKNNIEIFFYTGSAGVERLYEVLIRDWKASHLAVLGIQTYRFGCEEVNQESAVCVQFARLLSEVSFSLELGVELLLEKNG